ncbi:MAG: 8-amino-7-oxononanoate synthase [Gammaproteobacteria bacterium]|nr:8-amino-7-oxononanoate synthase [Gammaproteobacteria bacterium]
MTFDLAARLAERRSSGLYRERLVLADGQSPLRYQQGAELLSFCSNDYLGLASHPVVVAALQQGAERYGVGSGASHLIGGHTEPHHQLEEELADFVGRERALLFSTGYMANLGVLGALLQPGDRVYSDQLNHASLIDAARLSRGDVSVYPHLDLAGLSRQFDAGQPGHALVISDGVFSMDGDQVPLAGLVDIARKHNGWTLIDDAHGLGVVGPSGRGSCELLPPGGCQPEILMGTLGKAFGTFGAFVAGSAELIETLIQFARSYIYTTALPPAVAVATLAALRLVREEGWRRTHLRTLIDRFRAGAQAQGLPLMDSLTPIQPLLMGGAERAMSWSQGLADQGILVTAIRPPTVPADSARLRITFSAAHSEVQVDQLLQVLGRLQELEE